MSLSMHQASTPMFVQTLRALSAILGKAQAEVEAGRITEAELMAAGLAPDMFALPRQVQIATDMVKNGVARLAGHEPPAWPDQETTLIELRERIAKAVDYLNGVPVADVDGSETRDIHLSFQGGQITMDFKGQQYLLHFVIPNFFFHVTTAYDILRHKGVAVTKQDFIGTM